MLDYLKRIHRVHKGPQKRLEKNPTTIKLVVSHPYPYLCGFLYGWRFIDMGGLLIFVALECQLPGGQLHIIMPET